jgi:hypothetical protein
MALPGESPDVVLVGFAHLLPAALQVPGIAGSYIRALEVAGEDFLEVLPTINRVPWQVVQLGPNRVD